MTEMSMGSNVPVPVPTVRASLRWTAGPGIPDVDASAILLESDGEVGSDSDFIFYNQTQHYSGALRMAGKTPPPQASDSVDIDLTRVPADYQRVVLAASADGGTFGQVPDLKMVLLDLGTGQPIAHFPMSAAGETALVCAELYRRDGAWKFRAVGQGYSAGLAGLAGDFGIDTGQAEADPAQAAGPAPVAVPDFNQVPEFQPPPAVPVAAAPIPSAPARPAPAPLDLTPPASPPAAPAPAAAAPAPPALDLTPPAPAAPEPLARPQPVAYPPAPAGFAPPAPAGYAPTQPAAPPPPPPGQQPPPQQPYPQPGYPPQPPPAAPVPPPPAYQPPPAEPAAYPPPPAAYPPPGAPPQQPPPAPTAPSGVSLVKNQKVQLTQSSALPISRVVFSLGWMPADSRNDVDLDASVIAFDASGEKQAIVWYLHKNEYYGALQHAGDNRKGGIGGDAEQILVDLVRLPANVTSLVFTINSFRGHTFTDIANAYCAVWNVDTNEPLVRFDLSDTQPSTALLMAELRRGDQPGVWHLRAIGEYHDHRTVKKLVPAAARQVKIGG